MMIGEEVIIAIRIIATQRINIMEIATVPCTIPAQGQRRVVANNFVLEQIKLIMHVPGWLLRQETCRRNDEDDEEQANK